MSQPKTRVSKPKTLVDLKELMVAQLSDDAKLKRLAEWFLKNPRDVASLSKHEIAKKIGVSAKELTRLAMALNCLSYSELRSFFRKETNDGVEGSWYSSFVILRSDGDPVRDLLQNLFFAEMENLEETFEANSESIVRAANIVLDAKDHSVSILGWRSCFPAAYLFNYVYHMFRPNSYLVQDAGGARTDGIRWIGDGDVLIAISIAPYTSEVVEAVEYAAEKNVRIIAITDNEESPLARMSTVALYIESVTPSFFHSVAAIISVVEALIALIFILDGNDSLRRMKESEKHLARFRSYWPTRNKATPADHLRPETKRTKDAARRSKGEG